MGNDKGFTLVEVVVAMGIALVILSAVYMVINATQMNTSGVERKVAAQQDVKPALDLIAMEISMASYNPTFAANLWVNPPVGGLICGAASATQNYRGIQEATANSISVEMDTNANGILGNANETIRFNYDTGNQYITRETNCGGGGMPLLGNMPGTARAVRVINSTLNPVLPVFRYFNAAGAEIAAASLPGEIPNIRRILITLAIETEDVDPNTQQRRRLIYSTSVIPRNHAIIIN